VESIIATTIPFAEKDAEPKTRRSSPLGLLAVLAFAAGVFALVMALTA
jgi:hypothetical protein